MNKYPLIGVSICAVVLLVLGSLSNVVGYQTVQSSNQIVIKDEVSQKELLFQTIVDIANNKEIQRIILKSQISREGFFNPDMRFSVFNTHVLTKNQLKQIYIVGFMLSKIISKSRIQSMVGMYQFNNPEMQKEITAVIQKDATINWEIKQLSNSKCDCKNENTTQWTFWIICTLLLPLFIISYALYLHNQNILWTIMQSIGSVLNCSWIIH
jgi:hypothetical protein